jgi:hypothetical protein
MVGLNIKGSSSDPKIEFYHYCREYKSRKLNMNSGRILYLSSGAPGSTAWMRYNALIRIGADANIVDLTKAVPRSRILRKFHYLTGYRFLQQRVISLVAAHLEQQYDLVWVDKGMLLGTRVLDALKRKNKRIICLNGDNPFVARDGFAWREHLKTVSMYEHYFTVRKTTLQNLKSHGVKSAHLVSFAYDEEVHKPIGMSAKEAEHYASDVLFIGSWMEDRHVFIKDLIRRNVPISIVGNGWSRKGPEILARLRAGHASGHEYTKWIQNAKVCLGLVSRGNEDVYTTRSLEIPAIGSVFCGERTEYHRTFFTDGVNALLWKDSRECAERCFDILSDDERRKRIALAGRTLVLSKSLGNESVVRSILQLAGFKL